MTTLKVYNVITKETAAILPVGDRHIADKLVDTLRRNAKQAGEHGAFGWTVVELGNGVKPANDNE